MRNSMLKLLISFVFLLAFAATSGAEKWALLIGINKYDDPEIRPLKYSVADVTEVYKVLVDPERGGFKSDNVKLLTDGTEEQPTSVNIMNYLGWLQDAAEDDIVLIYYSGHGYNDSKSSYLLSKNAKIGNLLGTAVPTELFNAATKRLKTKTVITILDSCNSGGVSTASKGREDFSNFFKDVENLKTEAMITYASCKSNELSYEWPEKQHGVFTYYLAEGLRGEADGNKDGYIMFSEVADYVALNVAKWARQKGRSQTPYIVNQSGSPRITLAKDPQYEKEFAAKRKTITDLFSAGKLTLDEFNEAIRALDKALKRVELSNREKSLLKLVSDLTSGKLDVEAYREYKSLLPPESPSSGESLDQGKQLAQVISLIGNEVRLNLGSGQDVRVGDIFKVFPSTLPSQYQSQGSKDLKIRDLRIQVQPSAYLKVKSVGQNESQAEVIKSIKQINVGDQIEKSGWSKLVIRVNPWADIYIDGELVGKERPNFVWQILEGSHQLELKHPQYQSKKKEIKVAVDESLKIYEELK